MSAPPERQPGAIGLLMVTFDRKSISMPSGALVRASRSGGLLKPLACHHDFRPVGFAVLYDPREFLDRIDVPVELAERRAEREMQSQIVGTPLKRFAVAGGSGSPVATPRRGLAVGARIAGGLRYFGLRRGRRGLAAACEERRRDERGCAKDTPRHPGYCSCQL